MYLGSCKNDDTEHMCELHPSILFISADIRQEAGGIPWIGRQSITGLTYNIETDNHSHSHLRAI